MYQQKSELEESRFQSVNIPIERVEESNYQFSFLGEDFIIKPFKSSKPKSPSFELILDRGLEQVRISGLFAYFSGKRLSGDVKSDDGKRYSFKFNINRDSKGAFSLREEGFREALIKGGVLYPLDNEKRQEEALQLDLDSKSIATA